MENLAIQNLERIAVMENAIARNLNNSSRLQTQPDINAAINSQSMSNKLRPNFDNVDRNHLVNYGKNTAIALGGIGGVLTISKALQAFDSGVPQNKTKD